MALFKQKYRIESARLPGWDYAAAGWYFVTICTRKRICFFGDIVNGEMNRSAIGTIALRCWEDIPCHFSNVSLDVFVLMPNHLHGIVVIEPHRERRDVACNVSTKGNPGNVSAMSKISPQPQSLSAVVRSYKSAVNHLCRMNGDNSFGWQPRFYDHIIRDERSLHALREYLVNNPLKWELDKDNLENLYM